MVVPIALLKLGVKGATASLPSASRPRGFKINVETDIKAAAAQLKRVGERNVPLALAQSLTKTAKHLTDVQKRVIPKYIDRPTRFTKNGFGTTFARWRDHSRGAMFSAVYVRPIQAEYLKYQVYGGKRTPPGRAIVVPGQQTRLNKFGNLTRKYLQTQLARDDTHTATINGTAGLWKRMKSGRLKLLVLFTDDANYTANRYPFFKISEKVVNRELPKQLNKAVRRALNKGRG